MSDVTLPQRLNIPLPTTFLQSHQRYPRPVAFFSCFSVFTFRTCIVWNGTYEVSAALETGGISGLIEMVDAMLQEPG